MSTILLKGKRGKVRGEIIHINPNFVVVLQDDVRGEKYIPQQHIRRIEK